MRWAVSGAYLPSDRHCGFGFGSALGDVEGWPVDLDNNGEVGPFDLALLLGDWGP